MPLFRAYLFQENPEVGQFASIIPRALFEHRERTQNIIAKTLEYPEGDPRLIHIYNKLHRELGVLRIINAQKQPEWRRFNDMTLELNENASEDEMHAFLKDAAANVPLEKYLEANEAAAVFSDIDVPGDGNCYYHSVAANLIFNIMTGKIADNSETAGVLRQENGFLDFVIAELKAKKRLGEAVDIDAEKAKPLKAL